MKVKDILEILEDQDPEMEVYLSCDAEGNHFNRLTDHSLELVRGDEVLIYSEEELEDTGLQRNALVFWPL